MIRTCNKHVNTKTIKMSEEKSPNLYANKKEWQDITPLPLPQQKGDAFQVRYTDEYVDLMGYFFAVLDKKEVSKRALDITNDVISQHPAHYTAWWYKSFILENLGFDFNKELAESTEILKKAPKSYQAWNYRQWLFEHPKEDVSMINEIPFLQQIFEIDSKNFHAWSYAVWYAEKYKKFKEIYNLSLYQIEIDMRNNSAWNTRKSMADFLKADLNTEFKAAADSLQIITKNEAAVNFAFGIVEEDRTLIPQLKELGEKLYEKNPKNPQALHILLWIASDNEDTENIKKICNELIQCDPIRKPYYTLLSEGRIKYK